MRYIGIIILLVLCLTLLLLTGCMINSVTPEIASGDLENQEDIYQCSNNSQSSSIGLVYESVIVDTEEPGTVYPQKWATGNGTVENPWANNCIQKAYDFVPDGGTIFLKAGYYKLSAQVTITKEVNIIGEGMNKTIVVTANAHGFRLQNDVSYVSIRNLTIDGDAQTDGIKYLSCISFRDCDYASLEDIEVKNAGYYGIDIFQVNHSLFQNIYANNNWRHGMHPGSNTTGRNKYNTYRDIYAWDNGVSGFNDRGNKSAIEECYNVYDNLQCWDNGEKAVVIAYQKAGTLFNSVVSGNDVVGLYLTDLEDFTIYDCFINFNGQYGITIYDSEDVNFINVIVKNNSTAGGGHSGVRIATSNNLKFTSCQFFDDRATKLQAYGIKTIGSVGYIELVNCTLTPNAISAISNGAGAAITVITEKMLASF